MTKDMNKRYATMNKNTTRRPALSTFQISHKRGKTGSLQVVKLRAESESDARNRFNKTHKSSQILGVKYISK